MKKSLFYLIMLFTISPINYIKASDTAIPEYEEKEEIITINNLYKWKERNYSSFQKIYNFSQEEFNAVVNGAYKSTRGNSTLARDTKSFKGKEEILGYCRNIILQYQHSTQAKLPEEKMEFHACLKTNRELKKDLELQAKWPNP
ncbi:MAG: hypothetical protein ACXWL5_04895 [Candidatus Chromulinivorax sp.]